ncbi:MAG: hypothetical protein AAFW89_13705 [Bacteroidota bacterium]
MKNFEVIIADVPDREGLVAEIWYKGLMITELNYDDDHLQLDLYTSNNKISFAYIDFLQALESAKEKLSPSTRESR